MLALARENQRKAGATNVQFLKGDIENIPLPDNSVDLIISNCGINLSPDIDQVLPEACRVLKPGGCCAVSDIVVRGTIPAEIRQSADLWAGCVAGALEETVYQSQLKAAGFDQISIEPTRVYTADEVRDFLIGGGIKFEEEAQAVDGTFMSGFIRAVKPGTENHDCCAPGCGS